MPEATHSQCSAVRMEGRVAKKGGILSPNPLQGSRSTFSRGSFLSFVAFKEGMLGTPMSVRGGGPRVIASNFTSGIKSMDCRTWSIPDLFSNRLINFTL